MKLLLTSGGLSNKSIITALKDLTSKPLKKLNLAYIPTASNVEEGDKWWILKDLEICKKLGFKAIDIVDISALPKKMLQKRLESSDILFFEGGNTFHLMYWINKSGLKDIIPKLLKSKIWIGVSAGTIVATSSLELSSDDKEILKEMEETIYNKGLNLVNFLVVPHANNEYFPERTFDFVEKLSKKVSLPVYALDDESAIKVINNDIEVVSEGKWKKY